MTNTKEIKIFMLYSYIQYYEDHLFHVMDFLTKPLTASSLFSFCMFAMLHFDSHISFDTSPTIRLTFWEQILLSVSVFTFFVTNLENCI
jgi:hypothetical protein